MARSGRKYMNKKKAVAMQYNQFKDQALRAAASGKGYIAENIIEAAKQHQIPITRGKSMAEILAGLQDNEQIPEEIYHAATEVFAFIYYADKSKPDKKNNSELLKDNGNM